jgi:RNA recognition motif-containing protein
MNYGRNPPNIEGMVSLKVDNLTYRTTTEDLRRAFEKYGDVGDVYIPRDRFRYACQSASALIVCEIAPYLVTVSTGYSISVS